MIDMLPEEANELRRRLLIAEACRWIGTKEEGSGQNSGQIVSLFQAWDGSPDRVPWCAAHVQFCLKAVDAQYGAITEMCTAHKLARSEHCLTIWNNTPETQRIPAPEPGAVVIWQHWKNGKATSSGHTGIVISYKEGDDCFTTVEGNTGGDTHAVIREGDGVYKKTRSVKGSNTMKIKGFLRPW